MAEVVISYSREDRERIALIARQLEAIGVDVWFDRKIPAGRSFNQVILEEIRKSKVVLVCWSPLAVASKWVNAEATEADENNIYLPIKIAECKVGLPFNRLQTEDLAHWNGDPQDPVWLKIVDRIAHMTGRESVSAAARALGSGLEEDLYAFAKKFPDDPTAQRIWREAEQRLRAQFAERLIAAKQSVADRIDSERAAFDADLVFLNSEFETWLGAERRGAATGACPNPLELAESKSGKATKELRDQVSSLSRSLLSEQEKVERLSGAQAEAERLRGELDDARLALKKAKRPMRAVGRALLIGLIGAAVGFAVDRAAVDPSSMQREIALLQQGRAESQAAQKDAEEKLKIRTAQLVERVTEISALKSEIQSLRGPAAVAAKSLAEAREALADANAKAATAESEAAKNFSLLESRFVSVSTGCNGKSIFADSFAGRKEPWKQISSTSVGDRGLLIENNVGRSIIRPYLPEFRNLSSACLAFVMRNISVDSEKNHPQIGITYNNNEDGYYVFFVHIPNKKVYNYKYTVKSENGFSWRLIESAPIEPIDENKLYNMKLKYEDGFLSYYLNDVKVLSIRAAASGRDSALGAVGLYFGSTKGARAEVLAFGVFE